MQEFVYFYAHRICTYAISLMKMVLKKMFWKAIFFYFLLTNLRYVASDNVYRQLPRFWTSVGFCPAGQINHNSVKAYLQWDAVKMNLRQISALPVGAITHIRIHWLLELIQFVQYTQSGVPVFDFTDLDYFIEFLDELNLSPMIEFMSNPGNMFLHNPNRNAFLWKNFALQIISRYYNRLGATKISQWRFETWNEPDLHNYNILNFTVPVFLQYVHALRDGLSKASQLNLRLSGPAGLFKEFSKHPLCWKTLKYCNKNLKKCPIAILSYHRKGKGNAQDVLDETLSLLQTIYEKYPKLINLPLINSEADPIPIWSEPRAFYADVRYAVTLIHIVLNHWSGKLNVGLLKAFQALSHDNAFLSYHPNEFTQRTLTAHFRMNNTQPPYSQFIQKPVYAALGMLSKLGLFATDIEILPLDMDNHRISCMKSATESRENGLYLSILFVSAEYTGDFSNFSYARQYSINLALDTEWAYIVELLEPMRTDPAFIWRQYNSPAYPNALVRTEMRRNQGPKIVQIGKIFQVGKGRLFFDFTTLRLPWALLVRVCTFSWRKLEKPKQLYINPVTQGEVYINWREEINSTQCLQTYQVWYKSTKPNDSWIYISQGWHLPYPSFHFAPMARIVNGSYKVRGIDLFNRTSPFSHQVEYFEL